MAILGPSNLRQLLLRDHERLEALFEELLEVFREGHQCEIRTLWTDFESGLIAHFAFEERFLLPLFAEGDPAEAAALRAEHARFCSTVAELGVGVDLHLVPLDLAHELIEALRAHARREDEVLYRWAEREVAPEGPGAPLDSPEA